MERKVLIILRQLLHVWEQNKQILSQNKAAKAFVK